MKKETLAQVFSYEFCKFLRTPFLQNTSGGCFCKHHLLSRQYGHLRKTIFRDKSLPYSDKNATAVRKH